VKFNILFALLILLITGWVFSLAAKQPELRDMKTVVVSPIIGADQACDAGCHIIVEAIDGSAVITRSNETDYIIDNSTIANSLKNAGKIRMMVESRLKFRKSGGAFELNTIRIS
jgi:hypothetical protein